MIVVVDTVDDGREFHGSGPFEVAVVIDVKVWARSLLLL